TQSTYLPQLEWKANVAEYISVLYRKRTAKISAPQALKCGFPIYRPRFIPPSYNDYRLRTSGASAKIKPEIAYLRPINIIHPVFYPRLAKCPRCRSQGIPRRAL
ncbi:hypothetical protein FB451DRAFT_1080271, partial [Mycena latifolia]